MTVANIVHGTGIVLGRHGLLLRGPSGTGKSLLALDLLDRWESAGRQARLVADDRVELRREGESLLMYPPPAIAGLMELRGRGIIRRPHARRARLHLVVDLVAALERMPEEEEFATELLGLRLARCPVPRDGAATARHQLLLVREALRALSPGKTANREERT